MPTFQKQLEALPASLPELKRVLFFSDTGSTNDELLSLGKAGAQHGTLVVADHQSRGRGRMHRNWESPAGKGLYFSLLVRPKIRAEEVPLLTLGTGLALGESLRQLGIASPLIKWPNDVLIQGKKIAGTLTELVTKDHEVDFVVIGIGINVSQDPQDFSPEVKNLAASLKMLFPKNWDRLELLKAVLSHIFQEVGKITTQGAAPLIQRWNRNSGMVGLQIKAAVNGREIHGKVMGLNPQGHLLLQKENGEIEDLVAADTTII